MKYNIFLIIILLSFSISDACETINTVLDFQPGSGQNTGQSEEYFPQNIFGMPSENGSKNSAAVTPGEILSLGIGGSIIVGNDELIITDGQGPDFTIFENAFINPINDKIYAEPGVVSVSKDGKNFTAFPYDFETLEGCAGTTPTFGKEDPCNYLKSGGNSFDLADLGIDSVRYIKIQDITGRVKEDKSHYYYDFTLSGFDLDAVVYHNFENKPLDINNVPLENKRFYNLTDEYLESISPKNKIYFYSTDGRLLKQISGQAFIKFNELEERTVFFIIENNNKQFYEKVINL